MSDYDCWRLRAPEDDEVDGRIEAAKVRHEAYLDQMEDECRQHIREAMANRNYSTSLVSEWALSPADQVALEDFFAKLVMEKQQ